MENKKLSIINTSFDKTKNEYLKKFENKKYCHFYSSTTDIQKITNSLIFHQTGERTVHLIYQPLYSEDYTFFLSNSDDGSRGMVQSIIEKLQCDAIQIHVNELNTDYPIFLFTYFKNGEFKRMIRSMKDGSKWEFYENGKIQPFENEDYYLKRRVKDRVNRSIIQKYLLLNGIDIKNESCWSAKEAMTYYIGPKL